MCCTKRDGTRVWRICAWVGSTCLPPRAWLLGSWVGSASSPEESDITSDLNAQQSSLGVISMTAELATDGHAGSARERKARVSLRVGRFVPCAMHLVLAHEPPCKAWAQCVQLAVLVMLLAVLPATLAARVRPGGHLLKPPMLSRTPSNESRGMTTRTRWRFEFEF
jgi:hypothetical protein